jgi:hypothetical protein
MKGIELLNKMVAGELEGREFKLENLYMIFTIKNKRMLCKEVKEYPGQEIDVANYFNIYELINGEFEEINKEGDHNG